MRALLSSTLLLLVLAGGASAALPGSHVLVAVGHVAASGSSCSSGVADAELVVERGISPEQELIYTGTGTALLTMHWCLVGFEFFGGGQCFECSGTCRFLEDGAVECWYGWGGMLDAPDHNDPWGRYMRLDADGAFQFISHFGIPSYDYTLEGRLTRVA